MIDCALTAGGLVSRGRPVSPSFIQIKLQCDNSGLQLSCLPWPPLSISVFREASSPRICMCSHRSRLLNLQVPKPLRQCRVLLLLTCAPGFLELFTQFRRAPTRTHNTAEDLGRKGKRGAGSGGFTTHRRLCWFLSALNKRVQKTKQKLVSNGFQRNLKAFDPDEEQQQRGDADNRWCWISAC